MRREDLKSKLLAYHQRLKRLWLEIHQADLRDDSTTEAVFATGSPWCRL